MIVSMMVRHTSNAAARVPRGHGDDDGRLPHVEPSDAVTHRHDRIRARGGLLGDAVERGGRVGVRAVLQRDDGVRGIRVGVADAAGRTS